MEGLIIAGAWRGRQQIPRPAGWRGMVKILVSWSTAKDSAWCLQRLRATPGVEVVGLLATVNEAFGRVEMHAVRYELLEAEAQPPGFRSSR